MHEVGESLSYCVISLLPAPGPVSITSSKTFFQIVITWEKPERPNGVIVAYEVSYYQTADAQHVTRMNTTDRATSLTLTNLQPGTELAFTVRAYTQVGAGETNTIIEVTYISPRKIIISK